MDLEIGKGRGGFLCVVVDCVSLYGCQLTCVAAVVLMARLFGMGGREANFSSFVTLCNLGSKALKVVILLFVPVLLYLGYGPADFTRGILGPHAKDYRDLYATIEHVQSGTEVDGKF